jgi:hypothetical protein
MFVQVNRHMFHQYFRDIRPENFNAFGLDALFEYLNELEEDLGEPMEFDVVSLCCEYSQYNTLADYNSDYGTEHESWDDVADETTVIKITDEAAIIQQH